MAKTIGVLLSLKDQFTTPLQKANRTVKETKDALKKAERQVKAFTNRIKSGMKTVAKWGAIGFGALTAGAVLFAKQSIDAAKDQVRIEKLLETTMKRTSNASKEQIQAIKDEASALQNVGVIGDEVALAGANQLAVYGLRSDQIKKLMPNLNDMIAKEKGLNGTQEDAVAMADVIGKAMNGKTKGLLKYGVSLTAAEEKLFKTMKQEQRMEFISKKLNESIGGTNKALRETDEGKIVAAKNAWGDMKEEVGKKLLPYLGKFAEWFETKIPAIQNFILGIADKIQELVTKAEPYITQIKDMFGKIFEKVKPALEETWQILSDAGSVAIDIAQGIINHWDRISPIIYTVAGAITAYNLATTIRNNKEMIYLGYMKVKNALDTVAAILTGQLTIKQWALNAAMNANPIGLVIGLIAALIGIIWMAWRNWDKICNFIGRAWEWLKEVINGICEVLVGIFMPIWDAVCNAVIWLKDIILGVCDVLGGIFLEIWNGAIDAWNFMKDTISDLCDTITNVFLKAWEGIMKALDAVLHPIETAKNAFGRLIDKLKFWNKTPADDKTINITENTKKTTETVGGANKTGVATTSIKNPRHALGTAYFKGGVTGINEGGRDETAILPAGTQILSHEEGKSLQKNNVEKQVIIKEVESKKSSDKKVEVHIHIGGNFIGEKEHMEKYGEYTANKILAALNNM
ncbi:phage tail protein [Fusobacterium polymorphum]|uniref:phage tail protein n=1 Tax=Fusobacterium nucleatum subsp. polymorphum TaxID=76857 RepID=UPI001C6DEAC1|nr:phage tail protein [Fusobacterium polymorphum]QYR58886.1 phage tail protein [Fusobacterium polymorphum]